jgi:hypothetical protein
MYWIHSFIHSFSRRKKREHLVSAGANFADFKLRLRAGTGAVRDCGADFSRPCCVSFQAAVGILDEAKASFKGLEKDPDTTGETGNGPCHKNEEDQPKEGKARIPHCCCWMDSNSQSAVDRIM